MKKLRKLVANRKQIVFLDLEGTQFSHELISLGAVKASLNKDGTIKKLSPGFKVYVLARNPVGKIVEELTGINGALLAEKGISYEESLKLFKKYVGVNFSKSIFVTFGTHDLRILQQSLLHSPEGDHQIVKIIARNNLDLSALINEYVKDEKNNTYSLTNLCKLFGVKTDLKAHDALNDALMLSYLYSELFNNGEIIKEHYLALLLRTTNVARPIKKLLNKLNKGESVTVNDLAEYAYEEIE